MARNATPAASRRVLLSAVLVAAIATSVVSVAARAQTPPESNAQKTFVGFHVLDLTKVDIKSGEFLADLYFWIRYRTPQDAALADQLEKIEFMNGTLIDRKEVDRKPVDGWTYVAWRAQGTFHWRPDLRRYPFDAQTLPIRIEHANLQIKDFEFLDDVESYRRGETLEHRWGIGADVTVPNYEITRVVRVSQNEPYQTNFGDPTVLTPTTHYSRFEMDIQIERLFVPYLMKILVPLLIILLVAYLVFFVPAGDLETAAGLTVTSLLASIAFQMTLAGDMPEVGYVVTSDRIFHLTYLLIMLSMAETVMTFNLEKDGHVAVSRVIEAASRWIYPLGFLVGLVLICWKG